MLFYKWHQSQNFVASPNCLLSGRLFWGCLNLHFSANTPISWMKKEKTSCSVSSTRMKPLTVNEATFAEVTKINHFIAERG